MPNTPMDSTKNIDSDEHKKWMERQAVLEKKWDDCTVEEKLEKVREELTQLGYNTNAINSLTSEVKRLNEHNHDANGRVVVPLNTVNNTGLGSLLGQRRNNLA